MQADLRIMRYVGAMEDTVFLLGSKISMEMGPYNDVQPVLEDGRKWRNSVGASVHVREAVDVYAHEYLYGPVEIHGGEKGSGRAMHRVTYTGDAMPMADLVVADGIPFPLSGDVRDAVRPAHFASDPHVETRWWFRLVASSVAEAEMAADAAAAAAAIAAAEAESTSGSVPAGGAGASSGEQAPSAAGGGAPSQAHPSSPPPLQTPPSSSSSTTPPPINIPRIGALLSDPDGLYAYIAEIAREMASQPNSPYMMPPPPPTSSSSPSHQSAPLTVSTDRKSYARGQPISISGTTISGEPGAGPFVLISITGPGGIPAASLLSPVDVPSTGRGGGGGGGWGGEADGTQRVTYAASIDTARWDASRVPAGSMTLVAVRGQDSASTTFALHDNDTLAPHPMGATLPIQPPSPPQTPTMPPAAVPSLRPFPSSVPSQSPSPPLSTPYAPLTVATGDVAYRHGDIVNVSGTATRPMSDPFVLLSLAGPDGTAVASLTAHVGDGGRYSRSTSTIDWPIDSTGPGTVVVVAVRGQDTASTTFELLAGPSNSSMPPPEFLPETTEPGAIGFLPGGIGGNGTIPPLAPDVSAPQESDIGSAGMRSHIRYMVDANRTIADMIVYDHSVVVYMGTPTANSSAVAQPPTLWLRIPLTAMDPPDVAGDGTVFDVRIDGVISTAHTETADDTHRTLSIPILHTTGIVEVSGASAGGWNGGAGSDGAGESGGGSAGGGGGSRAPGTGPSGQQQQEQHPLHPPAQCTGTARCLRGTVSSVPSADTVLLAGGMSVRLALVDVPLSLESGSEQARALVASLCPAGAQLTADEDDAAAAAASHGLPDRARLRIVAEAYCNDGTASLQDILLASGFASIDRQDCGGSEFAVRTWAADACGVDEDEYGGLGR